MDDDVSEIGMLKEDLLDEKRQSRFSKDFPRSFLARRFTGKTLFLASLLQTKQDVLSVRACILL